MHFKLQLPGMARRDARSKRPNGKGMIDGQNATVRYQSE
jgi:hypothetical protein